MAPQPPEGIDVLQTPRGTTWRLPACKESKSVISFVVLLIATLFMWGVLSVFIYHIILGFGGNAGFGADAAGIAAIIVRMTMGLFLLPFIGVGLLFIVMLLSYWSRPRAEITIGDDFLYYKKSGGFLAFTDKRKKSQISGIRISVDKTGLKMLSSDKSASRYGPLKKGSVPETPKEAIFISADGAKSDLVIASGHDRHLLIPLANALAEVCATDAASVLNAKADRHALQIHVDPAPPTSEEIASGKAPVLAIPKPTWSKIMVIDDGQNTTIILPPGGLLKKGGFLGFGVLWLLFTNVGLTVAILSHFKIINGKVHTENIGMALLMLCIFEAVGMGMILGGIHSAKKKAVLIASKTELLFSQVSPIRNSEKRWGIETIKDITWGASGVEVNDVPQMQLQIFTSDGKKHGLFTGRHSDELAWLAQELKKAVLPA